MGGNSEQGGDESLGKQIEKALDPDLAEEAHIWVVVEKGFATLKELETEWDVDDLFRALAVIQMRCDIEAEMMRRVEKKAKVRK